MSKSKTIVFISRDMVLSSIVDKILNSSYNMVFFPNIQSSLDYIYNTIPDILIIDISPDDTAAINILNELKSDPIFGHVPVIAIFDDGVEIPKLDSLFIEDYIRRSYVEPDMFSKVDLCMHRAERSVEINPLTRLPGNIAINKQIQKRLDAGEIFALAYADLDFFKPYNDKYGFSRGDEVLKMLGRLILNSVKEQQPHGSFIGHIGGDDFVYIMEGDLIEPVSKKISDYFDRIIPTFYDSDDRAKSYIESTDREGIKKVFPIIGLSIGITHNKYRKFTHYGEMAEVASEMKKYAKSIGGSCYRVDKRANAPAG